MVSQRFRTLGCPPAVGPAKQSKILGPFRRGVSRFKYRSDYSVFERYVQRNSVSATFLWETTNFFWCVNTLLKPITLYVTLKKDCSLNVA